MDESRTAPAAAPSASTVRRVRRLLDDADASLAGRRVLALCSGGADSVALVAVLGALPRGAAPRTVDVLWLDHALRAGDGVAHERAAAQAAARSIGTTCHERRCGDDLAAMPGGVEAAARAWRYEEASRVARELGCDVVCSGHTADDQLEQALMSLVGITGRGGDLDAMPVARALDDGTILVRPLLGLRRDVVEAACRDAELAWADDPTNLHADAHLRNAVRHRVVPELLALHDGAGATLARAARRRAEERDVLRSLAGTLLDAWGVDRSLDVRRLARLAPAARRELVAAWLQSRVGRRGIGSRIVQAVEQLATGPARAACARVDLPGDACVRRDGYDLVITPAPPSKGTRP